MALHREGIDLISVLVSELLVYEARVLIVGESEDAELVAALRRIAVKAP